MSAGNRQNARRPSCPVNGALFAPRDTQSGRARRFESAATLLALLAAVPLSAGELMLARTVMPDAAPSSFAVSLPNGAGFCFDPVRGGISYAWQGGFVDLSPALPGVGKFIKPAKLPADAAYRETGPTPLRRGARERQPAVVFKGYRLLPEAVEFHYTVDGVMVREEVSARPAGAGLLRRFRIDPSDTDARWWYVPGATEGVVTSTGGRLEDGAFRFDAGVAREFTLEIVFTSKL